MKVKDLKAGDRISYQDKEFTFVGLRGSYGLWTYKGKETVMLYKYSNVLLINDTDGREEKIEQDVLNEHQIESIT